MLRYKKRTILNCVFIILMILPNCLEYIDVLKRPSKALSMIVAIFVIIYFRRNVTLKHDNGFWCMNILVVSETIATFISGGNIVTWATVGVVMLGLGCLISSELKKNKESMINALIIVFGAYILIESLSIFMGKDFLYNFNQVYLLFPAVAFLILIAKEILNADKKKYEFFFWLLLIVSVLMPFKVNAMLGKAGDIEASFYISVIAILIGRLLWKNKIVQCIRLKIMLLGILVIQIGIVFTQSFLSIPMVVSFVENVLHKPITLTGRTVLWEKSIELIIQKPIFGYGASWSGIEIWEQYVPPHNQFLYFLLFGGVLVLGAFVFWLLVIMRQLKFAYSNESNKKIYIYCSWTLGGQLLMMSLLSYGYRQLLPFFVILIIMADINSICEF